jgi:hypothetical protein
MDTKSLLRTGCITVLGVAVAAFAYTLGWQQGEVAGQERAIIQYDAMATVQRERQAEPDAGDDGAAQAHPAAAGASTDRP